MRKRERVCVCMYERVCVWMCLFVYFMFNARNVLSWAEIRDATVDTFQCAILGVGLCKDCNYCVPDWSLTLGLLPITMATIISLCRQKSNIGKSDIVIKIYCLPLWHCGLYPLYSYVVSKFYICIHNAIPIRYSLMFFFFFFFFDHVIHWLWVNDKWGW